MKNIIDVAKKELEATKQIIPKAVLKTNKGVILALMQFKSDEEKTKTIKELLITIKNFDCKEYFIVHESWVSIQKDDRLYRKPSRDIDRREAITITQFKEDRKNNFATIFFSRDNDGNIIFGEEQINEHAEMNSRWDYWADEKDILKKEKDLIEGHDKKIIQELSEKLAKKYAPKLKDAKSQEEFDKLFYEMREEIISYGRKHNQTILEDVNNE